VANEHLRERVTDRREDIAVCLSGTRFTEGIIRILMIHAEHDPIERAVVAIDEHALGFAQPAVRLDHQFSAIPAFIERVDVGLSSRPHGHWTARLIVNDPQRPARRTAEQLINLPIVRESIEPADERIDIVLMKSKVRRSMLAIAGLHVLCETARGAKPM
jgi:hypothetical protein